MSEPGENLSRIVSAWLAMLQTGNSVELASILDPYVVWQGILPEQICHNRDEVLGILVRNQRPLRLTRINAEEIGDRVAVSVLGPDFVDVDEQPAEEPRSLVFTFRAGTVVRINSLPSREAAFELAAH
ncbi:MAG: hypothetical protein M3P14_12055 [Chloroflexota bacterium]|nr:hypothetical protein [Chloroflexota bacterium]